MAAVSPYSPHYTHLDMVETDPTPPPPYSEPPSRNNSVGTTSSLPMYSDIDRRDSLPAYHARNNSIGSVRTRSIAYGAGVSFERPAGYEVSDDDIIVVAVRVSRRRSQEARAGGEDLPQRPPARSFLRRMSTRLSSIGSGDGADFKTLKMPRREYKRYFVRDNSGNYAGTEPQREWNEDELEREFGMYQHMRLVPAVGF